MTAIQFNQLQANLSEIYAALHASSKGEDLPLYATSSSLYFLLGSSFQIIGEIYTALRKWKDKEDLSLVAASSSLYFQGCWTGQIFKAWDQAWRWIPSSYSSSTILELVLTTVFDQAVHTAYKVRQQRIWDNIRQIDQILERRLRFRDFANQRDRYAEFISNELRGSVEVDNPIYLADFDERVKDPLSRQEVKANRHTIINFHQATHFFWTLFIKDQDDNFLIREAVMHLIKPSSTLTDRALFKALKKEGRWVQMEGIMEQAIPVALFAKLADPESLTLNEKKCLRLWVQALNRSQQDISFKLFSCVLSEIMNIIHLQSSSDLTLADFLEFLDQEGCQMIYKEDSVHINWREQLSPGDTIECNGKQLILGQQISPNNEVSDTFKIFQLDEYPNYVVKIAHNRLLLLVESKNAESEQEHWGVRFVKVIDNLEEDDVVCPVSGLDSEGRCVVIEKLSLPFEEYVWTSEKLELMEEDENVALVFANHIFCMIQWKATAQNLSLSHLMWDKEGVLKSTRLLKKGPANYNDWESYCASAAKNNPYVLSFLINVSKLGEHPIALYYRKAVEFSLETGKIDLIGRPLPLGHRLDIYNQHIKKLCEEALLLRKNCFNTLIIQERRKNPYAYKQEAQLHKTVVDKLLKFYRASPTPGTFSPNFKEEVINSFTKTVSLLDPSDARDYYQEKYDLMMDYNQTCLSDEETGS